jgi:hypothetical protein
MSETPMENYKNYMKLMDSFEITEELHKINAIHASLDEYNPMTYIILRETNRKHFTPSQILWLDQQIDRLHERSRLSFEQSLENVDVELAKESILNKSSDLGEVKRPE